MQQFPVRSAQDLSYEEFFQEFMVKNVPCLITDLIQDWPATEKMVKNDYINIDYFENLASVQVPVADCSAKYFNSQEKCEMSLKDYVSYWKSSDKSKNLYLKDWHFFKDFPQENIFQLPQYFKSDWLNEFWENKDSDYKFVYLGPKNSWTPFHSDVFGSFSWSANICGIKKWIFVPQGKEPKNQMYQLNLPQSDLTDFKLKNYHNLQYFEFQQGPKEVIFVPSGWYHQVENLTDTLSINHNWFNATNIQFVWEQLYSEMIKVQKEMQDCFEKNNEEWKEMCQNLLLASHGMNFTTFIQLLDLISSKRMKIHSDKFVKFDLEQIKKVTNSILDSVSEDLLQSDHEKILEIIKRIN